MCDPRPCESDAETFLIRQVFTDTPKGHLQGQICRLTIALAPPFNAPLPDSLVAFPVPSEQQSDDMRLTTWGPGAGRLGAGTPGAGRPCPSDHPRRGEEAVGVTADGECPRRTVRPADLEAATMMMAWFDPGRRSSLREPQPSASHARGARSAGRPRPTQETKRPGSLPDASSFGPAVTAYRSSSAIPTGTSCGGAGSSTRGGGAS
jgi:hypothetical protein